MIESKENDRVKETLLGEWVDESGSVLVLRKDGTFSWYLEPSKSEEFVQIGKYNLGKSKFFEGESSGQSINLDINKMVIAGSEIGSAPNTTEIIITSMNADEMDVKNLDSGNQYKFKRIA